MTIYGVYEEEAITIKGFTEKSYYQLGIKIKIKATGPLIAARRFAKVANISYSLDNPKIFNVSNSSYRYRVTLADMLTSRVEKLEN